MEIYKRRKIELELKPFQDSKEVLVITGFRRVGKTTLLQHIYDALPTSNKLFLDLESPVNQKLFQETNYDTIARSLSQQGINHTKKAFIFLDEIQKVKELPSVVKYLYDHYNIKFYLTGSSSFYLKNYFSESLAGRKVIFELYPLDFEEFLAFKGERMSLDAPYDVLSGLYREYLLYGGFPSVVLQASPDKKIVSLDDILGSYFNLDVRTLADFKSNENLKKLLFLLTSRVGGRLEVTKLAQSLDVSRPTVYEYLSFLEQTYLIHLLRPYSGSKDIHIKSAPKLYFNDTGLLNMVGQVSLGQLFENKIFNQLHMGLNEKIAYYQRKNGAEIDFVVDGKSAYEVKTHATEQDVKKLAKIAASIGIDRYRVVSLEKAPLRSSEKIIYPFKL